jgi:hypothetical protein
MLLFNHIGKYVVCAAAWPGGSKMARGTIAVSPSVMDMMKCTACDDCYDYSGHETMRAAGSNGGLQAAAGSNGGLQAAAGSNGGLQASAGSNGGIQAAAVPGWSTSSRRLEGRTVAVFSRGVSTAEDSCPVTSALTTLTTAPEPCLELTLQICTASETMSPVKGG